MPDDDLMSFWNELPRPPLDPATVPLPGFLWLGLANENGEVSIEGYERVPVRVPIENDILKFEATFGRFSGGSVNISQIGIWTSKTRGDMLYSAIPANGGVMMTGDHTLTICLQIQDAPMQQSWGFRRMLQQTGLL